MTSEIKIEYRPLFGLHWPNTEADRCYGYMLNRVSDVDPAMRLCRTRGVAVQAGGFIGMWPARLAKFFERVYTFEPIPHLFKCLELNTQHLPGVLRFNAALSDAVGEADITYKHGGCTRLVEGGRDRTKTVTVDSLNLVRCDALFLDVERHEIEALNGARLTIQQFHPVVTLETKDDTRVEYDAYMRKLGYAVVDKVHADVIYRWGK